jgi:thioester reductase-like protein
VAESIVRQAGASGLPVTIDRINTGGDSVTGVYNSQDHFRLIVQHCWTRDGTCENLFTVQAVPIDFATQAMVRLSLMPVANGKTYHIVNNQGMTGKRWSRTCANGMIPYWWSLSQTGWRRLISV